MEIARIDRLTSAVVHEHEAQQVQAPREITPSHRILKARLEPAELDRLILACLEKDPANRPQIARDLGDRLRSIAFANRWTEERARRWWLQNGARRRA